MANGRFFGKGSSVQEGPKGQIDNQEIARVAYGLYEQRGRQDGHDQKDWFQAEEVVRQQTGGRKS